MQPLQTETILDQKQPLADLAQDILHLAKQKGASQTDLALSHSEGFEVNVRLGEIDTLEYQKDRSLSIDVYFGQKKGSASTSDFSKPAVERAVQSACDIAQYTTTDPYAGLADAELMATEYPDLDLFHPWDLNTEQAAEMAEQCESLALAEDERLTNSEGVSIATSQALYVYANSHGFLGMVPSSRHNMSCVLVASDKQGMQRDYEYTCARVPTELDDIANLAKSAAHKTLGRLAARSIATQKTPVIFSAQMAKSLWGHCLAAISGGAQYRKSSFLLDKLNEAIFPEWVHVQEQPHIPRAVGSYPFDNEGVMTRAKTIIDHGRLDTYILSSYSARKLGLQTTGNAGGVYNLCLGDSGLSQQELLQEMGTGLLVTELIGHGVNSVTGDYSQGAAGFWVEKGEIVYPVEEITIAGNLIDMYQGMQAMANDIDRRSHILSGSVLINEMMVAGQS